MHSGTRGFCSGRGRLFALMVSLIVSTGPTRAQISPGDLSDVHANLEGLSKCTSCHSLGKAVSNEKCLACHIELKKRIDAGTGLHSHYGQRQCVECHKEHHGRDFSLVRFDVKTFDHNLTGYALEGRHAALQCKKCHVREHIKAPDILTNATLMGAGTYLGLLRDCLSCHADEHQRQLSQDCLQCHTYGGWKPATKFAHERARFQLTGKHAQVDCAKCHKRGGDPRSPVQFARMEFSRCSSCHRDPHAGRFVQPCDRCHTTAGWNEGPARNFDHSTTQFPLRGRHANVRCEQCHLAAKTGRSPEGSRGFHILNFSRCNDCHVDPHSGQFTKNAATSTCASCHTESGWKDGKARTFDHARTKFPLRGKHATTACARCHGSGDVNRAAGTAGVVDVRRFSRCMECHIDPHGGQFARRTDGGACESCHTEVGFSPSTFTLDAHDTTGFALLGAHRAIPCTKCHPSSKEGRSKGMQFVWTKEIRCADCHNDIHAGRFVGAKTGDCATCHSPGAWKAMTFRHDSTSFALAGKHAGLSCVLCHGPHVQQPKSDTTNWRFRGTPSRCIDCHPQSELQGTKKR